jgi:hypothetical protein
MCTTCFNIKKLCILPTQCTYGFRMIISLSRFNQLAIVMKMQYTFVKQELSFNILFRQTSHVKDLITASSWNGVHITYLSS